MKAGDLVLLASDPDAEVPTTRLGGGALAT